MSSSALEKWVVCRRVKADASIRLFCAAWAGGSASSFNKWTSKMPEAVELHALEFPGRMRRSKEDSLTSVSAIVEGVAQALVTMGLLDKPFALFGHSFGSLVMFELARKLKEDAGKIPVYLVVSGCCPPDMCVGGGRSPPISQLPRDALVDHLIGLGGMPEELRDQTELVDYFLPPIRADYTAYEGYRYEPRPGDDSRPITCPIICLGGEEDGGAPRSDLELWSSLTAGEFRLQMFGGGHFFLQGEGEQAVLTFLGNVLTEKLR
ncbi:unnamed protein product [Ectocarpus sp. CCAP 1310/34]|nr:unnamed protein product [Ectocarpus sp. CCAP 1310/34]